MQVVIHAGSHETEEDRLLKTLLQNKEAAGKRGTAVPGPGKYRYLLGDCVDAMLDGRRPVQDSGILWDGILEQEQANRVILSNPHFMGAPRNAVGSHGFYPEAEMRLGALQQLFPDDELEIQIGLRDPGSFLPALLRGLQPQRSEQILRECELQELRWSNLLLRLRTALPDVPITVWFYEEMPLIWADILRSLLGFEPGERLIGGMDLLAVIMSGEGMQRLRAYLHEHREMSEEQKHRVIGAFLDKYAIEDAIEEEVDLPGWTDMLIEQLSVQYDADLDQIAAIPGVTILSA
ncbi:hypothetical protein [Phycobacter azelaicus]|jgi:hypothetical protein|uniref:hypothetical protein n=1 Tax=Phycobacter azelaicus TaxID=2668075 RepID=UPI001865DF9E|nr:hypothetical protein [Phycobacter azelaicus]MBE1297261.1 hypothetical protein [Paracoccaceae bacterium]